MTKEEIIVLLKQRAEMADRTFEAFQQLQGQLALLRDMLKSEEKAEQEKAKLPAEPPPVK